MVPQRELIFLQLNQYLWCKYISELVNTNSDEITQDKLATGFESSGKALNFAIVASFKLTCRIEIMMKMITRQLRRSLFEAQIFTDDEDEDDNDDDATK